MWRRGEVNPDRQVMEDAEVGGGCGGYCKSRHHPRKHDVGSERFDQLRAHARYAVEPRQAAEGTMLVAPADDPLCKGRADSRETRDLRHVGAVEVDPLTGQKRPRQPGGVARRGGEPSGGRCIHRHELHVTGRRGFGRRERQSHARAGEREEGEQEGGFAIIHDCTLTARQPPHETRFTPATPENRHCTSAEYHWKRRGARRPLTSIPHSALRIPHCYRTNATATSPTTCSDAALTLSIVSSVVCQYG